MSILVICIFTAAGAGMAYRSFLSFPWKEKPTRKAWLLNLMVYLIIGGGIGFLAGGWLAGRLP
jgi:hypothetical protein